MCEWFLLTKIWKAFKELKEIELLEDVKTKVFAAQAKGCNPIVTAIKNDTDVIRPVRPDTVAKSLAIGNPADGYYAYKSVKESGGYGEDVTDDEIIEGIKLLAKEEGIFAETAGGVTVATTKKLIEKGYIEKDEITVICVTGNGLKTKEALEGKMCKPLYIKPTVDSFEEVLNKG